MAMCDYRACDVCGCKTFYDARLDWESNGWREDEDGTPLPSGAGSWAVICETCAETHKCVVVRRADREREEVK